MGGLAGNMESGGMPFAVGGADADPRLRQVSPLGINRRHFSNIIQNLSKQ
ncbi:MAG TPA: hypothetical protein PL157_11210 [Acidobacteriota bacterium]|nr:hypothetical protein [Acidobacteriota bacterium]